MIKMYAIFCRETLKDFQSNEGKLAAQAGHAYLHAWWDAEKRLCDDGDHSHYYKTVCATYKNSNDARKIALVVDTIDELNLLAKMYKNVCGVSLVEDCGYTIFDGPTITCLGLGPIHDDDKHPILKSLSLLRREL